MCAKQQGFETITGLYDSNGPAGHHFWDPTLGWPLIWPSKILDDQGETNYSIIYGLITHCCSEPAFDTVVSNLIYCTICRSGV